MGSRPAPPPGPPAVPSPSGAPTTAVIPLGLGRHPCHRGGVEIRSERRYSFPVSPAELWSAMGRVDEYRRWWPWLHRFSGERAEAGLVAGAVWRCEVHPPVPYSLTFAVALDEVVPAERVRATVTGDVVGRAEVVMWPAGPGDTVATGVRFASWLAPGNRMLRAVAAVAPPVARFGHDWVLDAGGRRFREHALAPEPT